MLWQPTPAASLKRPCPTSPDGKPQPQPLLTTALPIAIWEDHLLPLLTCKDAARLGCTFKALRELVREHYNDLGEIGLKKLQAALTTFPRARSVEPYDWGEHEAARVSQLVEWLREGGHGRGITSMLTRYTFWRPECDDVNIIVHAALRGGALPSLKSAPVSLMYESHRASLTEGLLRDMEEMRLKILFYANELMAVLGLVRQLTAPTKPQLAALGLVRQLPALTNLELMVCRGRNTHDDLAWLPFIPSSLKALRLLGNDLLITRTLLPALPGMLRASGAGLERLELELSMYFLLDHRGDGPACLIQTLRCCSPTLKAFRLGPDDADAPDEDPDAPDGDEGVSVRWAAVLAGVSACRELEVLVLPLIDVEALFPPGTAFGRLTHLEIGDCDQSDTPDAGVMGLWELMASGGLPALAKLNVRLHGWWEAEEVKTRVAPAFEAVAGTLMDLILQMKPRGSDKKETSYELGVAIGKLRRLKDLTLNLSTDGRDYHAAAQGMVDSGGDRPLPLLWRVRVPTDVEDVDLLVSLLLPSV
jgi:hypothetical protein